MDLITVIPAAPDAQAEYTRYRNDEDTEGKEGYQPIIAYAVYRTENGVTLIGIGLDGVELRDSKRRVYHALSKFHDE